MEHIKTFEEFTNESKSENKGLNEGLVDKIKKGLQLESMDLVDLISASAQMYHDDEDEEHKGEEYLKEVYEACGKLVKESKFNLAKKSGAEAAVGKAMGLPPKD